ncbi:TetR/AcrR family transcriptional regulator [Streptomyces amakusaensis]|uniref:TetR/AcrR family transcriptional regulator n=2 Tax=Streptomyces amakusaensis TaxID=67271 RepID=A0ABW0AVP0_9ACTN
MHAFWRQGYRATSTRDLSDCTGIGPSSLYNAFGDKRQLYLRTLRQYYSTNTVAQTEGLRAPGSAKGRIRNLMVQAIDIDLSGNEPAGCFAINALIEMGHADSDVNDELNRHFSAVEDALCETIAEGQLSGEIAPGGDARVQARQVLSTYYGLRVLARIQKDRNALLDVVESALDAL